MAQAFLRLFLSTAGRLSRGVQLCYADGPAAGTTLSYAYRNVPQGRWLVGRWIDARFLRYAGWEHARDRLAAVREALCENIRMLRAEGIPAHMMDIACGGADYVPAFGEPPQGPDSVLCRDLCARTVAAGAAGAEAAGRRQVRFEQGDALDHVALLAVRPRPTLVLSCGLYELMDDPAFERSLAIIAELLPRGGRLVLAHQVAHDDPARVSDLFRRPGAKPTVLHLRPREAIAEALARVGLTTVRETVCGGAWYVVMTARKEADGSGAL